MMSFLVVLSSFSTTTDNVYNKLMRSHDPSEADFLAVEAAVLNVSLCGFTVVTMTMIIN